MKKYLLGTSALVAATMVTGQANAADKFTMGVGGFMEQFFGYMNNEDAPGQTWNNWGFGSNDTEIHFKGTMLMDNGIKVAARVEIEANEDAQNVSVDEVWLQLSSDSLGLLSIGSDDMPNDGFKGYPKVGIGLSDVDNWIRDLNITGGTDSEGANSTGSTSDAGKIVYYSPLNWQKEWGVQVMAGFAPNMTNNNTEGDSLIENTNQNAYNIAISYSRRFGEVDTYFAYGYLHESDNGNSAAAASISTGFHSHSVGVNFVWGPWELGGGWAKFNDGFDKISAGEAAAFAATESDEGYAWNAGLAYTMGAWQFGYALGFGDHEGLVSNPNHDRRWTHELAAKYDFGNGLTWRTSAIYARYREEAGGEGANDANQMDDGFGLVTGFALTF